MYCAFALSVESVQDKLASWSAGCPCHWDLFSGLSDHEQNNILRAQFGCNSCPMWGKRAAELACGHIYTVFNDVFENLNGELLLKQGSGVTPEQLDQLMTDIASVRACLSLTLQTKTDYWNRVPWVLCGVGLSWDPDAARRCATAALRAMEDEPRLELHSRHTTPFMVDPLHTELKAFAHGQALHACSRQFQLQIAELFFMPTDETVIEQPHAATSIAGKKASGNFSAVGVSLSNRWPELDQRLRREPTLLKHVLELLDSSRDWRLVPSLLGVVGHPYLAEVTQAFPSLKRWRQTYKALRKIIYHVDLHSQFQNLSVQGAMHGRRQIKEARQQSRVLNEGVVPEPVNAASMRKGLMLDHLRAVGDEKVVYSFDFSFCNVAMQSVQSFFSRPESARFKQSEVPSRIGMNSGTENLDIEGGSEPNQQLFFRMLKTQPSRLKQVPVSLGARSKLRQEHVAVEVSKEK